MDKKQTKILELESKLTEAKQAEDASDVFSASFLYKEALGFAREAGDSDTITFCKIKMRECNILAKDKYERIEVEQDVPEEIIDAMVQHFLRDGLETCLYKIGRSRELCPKYQEVIVSAQEEGSLIYQIANLTTVSNDGHLVRGGSEGTIANQMQTYSIHLCISTKLLLNPVMRALVSDKGLDTDNFMSFLEKVIPEENISIVETGVRQYFSRDYISMLHILIPQFEALFLKISEMAGVDIVALNQGKEISTRKKVFSQTLLMSDEISDVWSEDFCRQLDFVLLEPLGYMLRHKVAHGTISRAECDESNANLILFFFIVIASSVSFNEK